jgi:hypothetical protein
MTKRGYPALALLKHPVLAHEGHYERLPPADTSHPLTQPDHQLAFAGVVVLVIYRNLALMRPGRGLK